MNLDGREGWRKGRKRIRIKKRTLWYTCGHKLVEVTWHNVIGERCLAFRALPLIATIKPFPFQRFASPPGLPPSFVHPSSPAPLPTPSGSFTERLYGVQRDFTHAYTRACTTSGTVHNSIVRRCS